MRQKYSGSTTSVAPVVVMSTMISAMPAAGAPSVAPRLSRIMSTALHRWSSSAPLRAQTWMVMPAPITATG